MSGSRHKRMNAVRTRKEGQVYTAEEQRRMAIERDEERRAREKRIVAELRGIVNERLGD
jgi:hypothetical protein